MRKHLIGNHGFANLFQVSHLIFDHCFKAKWGIILKCSYISYILVFGIGTLFQGHTTIFARFLVEDNHFGSGLVICVSVLEKLSLQNRLPSKLTDAFFLLKDICIS